MGYGIYPLNIDRDYLHLRGDLPYDHEIINNHICSNSAIDHSDLFYVEVWASDSGHKYCPGDDDYSPPLLYRISHPCKLHVRIFSRLWLSISL